MSGGGGEGVGYGGGGEEGGEEEEGGGGGFHRGERLVGVFSRWGFCEGECILTGMDENMKRWWLLYAARNEVYTVL